ncbi:hypothetical protein [Nonomuraea angiospora]
MAERLTPCGAENPALRDRLFADNASATNLMAEEVSKAQLALRDAFDLLRSISIGGDDGDLSPEDHTDAVYEIIFARRALRRLTRIVSGHADYLEGLAAGDQAEPLPAPVEIEMDGAAPVLLCGRCGVVFESIDWGEALDSLIAKRDAHRCQPKTEAATPAVESAEADKAGAQ